jgi:hypothetical protein
LSPVIPHTNFQHYPSRSLRAFPLVKLSSLGE